MKWLVVILFFIPNIVQANTEAIINIDNLNIYEIQENIEKGYLTYEQLVNIYLERINEYSGQYNAIISINENAIKEAKELDELYQKNGFISELHGIPILVKDNIDVLGLPTTNGAKGLLDAYPADDAEIIKQLRDAGAIILGKTNMSEFAFYASTSKSSFGYVYNAYDLNYSAYGSSGGSAVSVAVNLAVAAIGTDTNSSIRVPAAAAGIVGLRPTHSTISGDGIVKYDADKDVAGPMTKYIEDAAIILEIIDNTNTKYQIEETNLEGITIGVFDSIYNKSEELIKDLMDIQINHLEDLGAKVIFINTISINTSFNQHSTCYDFMIHMEDNQSQIKTLQDLINNGNYTASISSLLSPYCETDFRLTNAYENYQELINQSIKDATNQFEKEQVDVVIYPTINDTLIKKNQSGDGNDFYSLAIAPTTGFPSISIPIGYHNDLPYGMELLTITNQEQLLFQIGYNLQEINNAYKLPSIAPNLYEVSTLTEELINIYEKNNDDNKYQNENEQVLEYINEYNDIEDKEEQAKYLINNYEVKEASITFVSNTTNIISHLLIIIILLLALTVMSLKLKRIIDKPKRRW